MGIFDIFSSKPVQSEGIPVRYDSLVNDIPESQRDAAVSLFQRLIQEYYPNSKSFDMEHYKSPRCSFDDMRKFFDANAPGNFPDEATIPGRMQAELLRELPKVAHGNEREAFLKMEQATQRLVASGVPEDKIPETIENFNKNSKGCDSQRALLILEYKTARAVYDVVVNNWATSYVQSVVSIPKGVDLSARITVALPDVQLGIFDRLLKAVFGYKTETYRMFESRHQHFLDSHDHLRNIIDQYAHLEKPMLEAMNAAAQKFNPDLKFDNLNDAKKWLEVPADPRVLSLSQREKITKVMSDAVISKLNGIINPSWLIESMTVPRSLRSHYLDAFNELAMKYNIPSKITENGIDQWLKEAPSTDLVSKETYQCMTAELEHAIRTIQWYSDRKVSLEIPEEKGKDAVQVFQWLAEAHPTAFKKDIKSVEDIHEWLQTPNMCPQRWMRAEIILKFNDWLEGRGFSVALDQDEVQEPSSDMFPKEGPVGIVRMLPPLTEEERKERVADIPMFEGRATNPLKKARNFNEESDRIWETATVQEKFLSMYRDIQFLDKQLQKYAIYQFNQIGKKHFPEEFAISKNAKEMQAFFKVADQKSLTNARAFVQEYRPVLNKILEQQTDMNYAARMASHGA